MLCPRIFPRKFYVAISIRRDKFRFVSEDGIILNDPTVDVLVKMALSQADAGADLVESSKPNMDRCHYH